MPDANAQIYTDSETLLSFARLVSMFVALREYTRSLISENSNTGAPLQRPLFLHYPADPVCYDIQYQYMYGPDLIVAPVLLEGVEKWRVYLPGSETWISLYDKEGLRVEGGRYGWKWMHGLEDHRSTIGLNRHGWKLLKK